MKNNLENLHAQLNEWEEKLAYFQIQEAKITDLGQKFAAHKAITEAEAMIKGIQVKLSTYDPVIESKSQGSDKEIKTLHQALDLFVNQKDKLGNKTTQEEIEEVEKLKIGLYNELFGDYNAKLIEIPVLKDKKISNLFDRCFASEKIDKTIIDDIYLIRKDNENFKYYHRSIIVSALTLSLLNFKSFDLKKLDQLIDFLTDFEEEVWKRALTGIVLVVLVNQNRLERYPQLIKRLEPLQQLEKVQVGIHIIDKILRRRLFEHVAFPEILKENEFLSNNPYNWFFPFYENNKIITSAIENTEQDIDTVSFSDFIYKVPLIDCFKYIVCKGVENNKIQLGKKVNDSEEDKDDDFLSLDLAYSLHPYYNLVSEFYLYYKYFPALKIQELFNSKTTIAATKLKNIILSKVQGLKLNADLLFENKEYKACISKLKELLNIEPNQFSALVLITQCYEITEQFSDSAPYLFQIEKINPDYVPNLFRIAVYLRETKLFLKSNEYLLRANKIDEKDEQILDLISSNFFSLKEYDEAIKISNKILEINPKNVGALSEISICYSRLNQPKTALEYSKRLHELEPENPHYMISLAGDYSELGEVEKSNQLAEKAYFLKNDDIDIAFQYARILFVNANFTKAKLIFEKILGFKKAEEYLGIIYGNLAHIELFENGKDSALKLYQKCVLDFDDISDFSEKFDVDLVYALKQNITKDFYENLKIELVNYWKLNKI